MKYTIKIIVFALFATFISACGDDKKTTQQAPQAKIKNHQPAFTPNKAVILIGKTRYTLPIRLCSKPRTDRFKGQSITHYSVLAQQGLVGQKRVTYPVFSISGVTGKKGDISSYKLELKNNGVKKTYSGKAPFNLFNGNKLHYKGMTTKGNGSIPVEIFISCK